MSPSPEQEARTEIDRMLAEAGWLVQDVINVNLHASRGVAIREFPLERGFGFADYLLYVDGKAAGVIEAKKAGVFAGSYREHLHLEIKGIMRYPFKFDGKDIKITLLGDRTLTSQLTAEEYVTPQPVSVGHLTIRGQYRDYLGSIPFDAIPVVSSLLQYKQVRFIDMSGKALFRGSAPINWIHFMRDFDPEEW